MAETYKQRRQRLAKIQLETKELQKEIKSIQRKEETRQLIIRGRWVGELLKRGLMTQEFYAQNMDWFLTRNVDRELLGFPLLPEPLTPDAQKTPTKRKHKAAVKSPDIPAIIADPPPSGTTDQQSFNNTRKLPEYNSENLQEAFDL